MEVDVKNTIETHKIGTTHTLFSLPLPAAPLARLVGQSEGQPTGMEDGASRSGTGGPQGENRCETRFSEQGKLEEVDSGYSFFWDGRPKADRRDAGVVFPIRNDIVGRLPCLPQDINGRLMRPACLSRRQIRHHHQCLRSPDDPPRRREE
nr:unnamed protein product [Spirometra erinaceieuropaei]